MTPSTVTICLVETEKTKLDDMNYLEIKKSSYEEHHNIVTDFLEKSNVFYQTHVTEVEDKKGAIGIYIFDDYWELSTVISLGK